ncbi:MAG: hypothetical protein Q9163_002876 [Psora crenata]
MQGFLDRIHTKYERELEEKEVIDIWKRKEELQAQVKLTEMGPQNCAAAKALLSTNHRIRGRVRNTILQHTGDNNHHHAVSIEKSPLRLFVEAHVYKRKAPFFKNRRLKSNYFSFLHQPVSRMTKRSEEPGQNHILEAKGAARTPPQSQERPAQQRQRCTSPNSAVKGAARKDLRSDTRNLKANPIQRWVEEGSWSGGNFDQDSNMAYSLTRKRSTPSLSKHESDISGVSLREGKNPAVKSRRYETILASASIYMGQPEPYLRVTLMDKALCQELLKKEQPVPIDSLFNADLFESTCEDIANRNEARVIQDIGRLIVPAPEELFRRGATHLKHLIETVDESWIKSIPLVKGPRPQPDFAVALKPSAFTADQLKKLQPSVGDWQTTSCLVATDEMYFPFLTAEVKCGNEALNIADRQNAHSAAVAANAVVELYRLVSRQDELHQKILTFSISHDHRAVRIYVHYVLINGKHTSFYRYLLRDFSITDQDGIDKWTAYKFTLSVYNDFRRIHHERVCSAIDQLPNPEDFAVESFSQQSNLVSLEQDDSQLTISYSQQTEPEPPSSQTSEPVVKRPKGWGKKQLHYWENEGDFKIVVDYDPFEPAEGDIYVHGIWEAKKRAQINIFNNAAEVTRNGWGYRPAECYRRAIGKAGLGIELERAILNWDILIVHLVSYLKLNAINDMKAEKGTN